MLIELEELFIDRSGGKFDDNRPEIVAHIYKTIQLKKKGNNYFGICPFCDEKTPAVIVSSTHQAFFCFCCLRQGYVKEWDEQVEMWKNNWKGDIRPKKIMTKEERDDFIKRVKIKFHSNKEI